MTTPTLFYNEDQDDADLCHKYVNTAYGLTWRFKPFRQIGDQEAVAEIAPHYDDRGIGQAVATLFVRSASWEGKLTILPKTYKQKVRNADHSIVVDEKTGKPKTRLHRYAGKRSRPTPDLINDLPDDVIAGAYASLTAFDGARSVAEQESFREPDPARAPPEAEEPGGGADDRPKRKRQGRREDRTPAPA